MFKAMGDGITTLLLRRNFTNKLVGFLRYEGKAKQVKGKTIFFFSFFPFSFKLSDLCVGLVTYGLAKNLL